MKKIFIAAFIADIVLTAVSLIIMPDRVAVHFGLHGSPDAWASKQTNAFFFLLLLIPLFLLLFYSPRLILRTPPWMLNLPNKHYWLKEENKPELKRKFERLIYRFGFALFLFFFCILILTISANLSEPVRLEETLFIPAVVLFLGYTAIWCISLYRSFKIPG